MIDTERLLMTPDEIASYRDNGYLIVRELFSSAETAAVNDAVNTDPGIAASVLGLADRAGGSTEIALWRSLDNDIFGAVSRSRRVVDRVEAMLEGPADFYHAKLTLKKPKVGGAWDWHQDFGYWYRQAHLAPNMMSVMIALDAATPENGCLQVLKGSHKLGRIEHGVAAGQVGADLTYVEQAMKRFDLVDCVMAPGDALFFHSNLLHASGANTSDHSRNVLLCCYNRQDNVAFAPNPTNANVPIDKLDDAGFAEYLDRPLADTRRYMTAETVGTD